MLLVDCPDKFLCHGIEIQFILFNNLVPHLKPSTHLSPGNVVSDVPCSDAVLSLPHNLVSVISSRNEIIIVVSVNKNATFGSDYSERAVCLLKSLHI